MTRRTFQRAGEAERRKDLIAATLDSISDHGLEGATVRDIAARAGVTGGLIRHYFSGKDEMVQAAYREMLAGMTKTAVDAMAEGGMEPRRRLHNFIVANVSAPIADPKALSLWAAFIGRVRSNEDLTRINRENYLIFVGILEDLVEAVLAAESKKPAVQEVRDLAVAINGLIDGLWLENSLGSDLFDEGRLSQIALDAVEAIMGGVSLRDRI